MKKSLLAGLTLALAVTSGSALASQYSQGVYFTADTGTSSMNDATGTLGAADTEEDNNIYALGIGKTLSNDFFAEVGYTKLLDVNFTAGSLDVATKNSALTGRVGKNFAWNDHVAFTALIGAAYINSEGTWTDGAASGSFDDDAMSALAGVGMNLSLTENLDARVRYERIISVDANDLGDFNLDNLTVGIAYHW